ncbi:MAG: hypothetical protein H0X08_07155 [Blastocatellia bacterium]|nr:hypothetical protein [Blastocatellia bacterium]
MSNPIAVLLSFLIFTVIAAGCGGSTPTTPAASTLAPDRSDYPFEIAEPEVYTAKVFVMVGNEVTGHFLARSGDRSRTDINVGTPNHTSRLVAANEIVVSYGAKTYYEIPRGDGETANLSESSAEIRGLFASPERARFEKVGDEDGLTKYRVTPAQDDRSEIYIYVDAGQKMIMRQEFFTGGDAARTLTYSAEMRELSREAPDELFAIPNGFRKVNAP